MICHHDMTFCVGECDYLPCHRNEKNLPRNEKGTGYDTQLPIAFSDFRRECKNYLIPQTSDRPIVKHDEENKDE